MKIVLDTNVVISGIFFSGSPYKILDSWRNRQLEVILSLDIYEEYHRVATILNQKYSRINIHPILELILKESKFIVPVHFDKQVCADPDDDKFLECALSGDVKVIVPGDKHLLDVNGYQGIEIIRPAEFIKKYVEKV